MRLRATFLLVLLTAGACARTLPPDRASAALYRDFERLVGLAGTAGWGIDRLEINGLLADALDSVCRVEPEKAEALLEWLDARIEALGGPVEEAYENRGKKLGRVKELLALTRIRMALERTLDAAEEDCPFWISPSPGFRGRQISDDRWQLSFGGGGKGILVSQAGRQDIYFGGAGRLAFGRAIGQRWSLYTGLEGGASASFPRDNEGGRGNLVLGVDVVTPLIARYRFVNSYLEAEAGYLARFTEEDSDAIHGMHVGVAFGGRAARRRWFFPGAVFGVSYERTFPRETQGEPLQTLKLGFRVAIDINL
jgi:hypothetical protein